MNLYILRHAIALEQGVDFHGPDPQRPLSAKGKKKMQKIARGMKSMELSFDAIISSPFARASETAGIVAKELGLEDVLEFSQHLESGGESAALIAEIAGRPGAPENVLLVGHEPQLSQIISVLLSGDRSLELAMKKGGLCKLEIQTLRFARCASLQWLLTPSQLAMLST